VPFAAALSEHPSTVEATAEVVGEVLDGVGAAPDLAALFVSSAHIPQLADVVRTVDFPVDDAVDVLADQAPHLQVIGGMASAGLAPGANRLVVGGEIHTDGAVGVLVPPDRAVTTVVSQGCRPVGDPYVVTRAEGNVIAEMGGTPALVRLDELFRCLGDHDRGLVQQGLHIGRVIDEHKADFGRGDFLVRNVIGADRATGAIAIGDVVPVGATVQFHVRDAASADEDLLGLLSGVRGDGALVFTCNGRGTRLFGRPDHDAELVADVVGGAAAGMFCAGEIGPVGRRSFVHGFTASLAIFRDQR
jgi:small ligand-binding sensory domain FIST